MKLGFMSSVCPDQTLAELIETGKTYGYAGIEFRPEWDHAHGIELDASSSERKAAAKILSESPLAGVALSPGTRFNQADKAERDAELEKLYRYIDLAAEVGIPYMRVFGDPLPMTGNGARARQYEVLADYYGRAAERAGAAGVTLAIETHMNFRGVDAGEVMFRAAYPPALRVNWHLGHCLRHGEAVDEAYRHVKGRVVHVHFSLSDDEVRNQAQERQVALLRDDGYEGYFSIEVINPDDPIDVLERHAAMWVDLKERLGF
jgi:sugar phosphate isomerase/epimerase